MVNLQHWLAGGFARLLLCALPLISCADEHAQRRSTPPLPGDAGPASVAWPHGASTATTDASASVDSGANPSLFLEGSPCKTLAPETSALALSAFEGDIVAVRRALASGARVDDRSGDEASTPLMMALAPYIPDPGSPVTKERQRRVRKLAIARLLLTKGADVKLADGHGMTALHRAVSSYHNADSIVEEWVTRLLKADAPVNARTCAGMTALEMAEERNRAGVVRLLSAASANAD
jgi:Ankyrin repeats (3 copies)